MSSQGTGGKSEIKSVPGQKTVTHSFSVVTQYKDDPSTQTNRTA